MKFNFLAPTSDYLRLTIILKWYILDFFFYITMHNNTINGRKKNTYYGMNKWVKHTINFYFNLGLYSTVYLHPTLLIYQ